MQMVDKMIPFDMVRIKGPVPGFRPDPLIKPCRSIVQGRVIAHKHTIDPPPQDPVARGVGGAFLDVHFKFRPNSSEQLCRTRIDIGRANQSQIGLANVTVIESTSINTKGGIVWAAIRWSVHKEQTIAVRPSHKEHFVTPTSLIALKFWIRPPDKTYIHFALDLWSNVVELHATAGVTSVEG